jgi:hypothetical protein
MMPGVAEHPLRELTPPGSKWWEEEKLDEYSSLEEALAKWQESLVQNEELFKKHVYEKDDLCLLDLR